MNKETKFKLLDLKREFCNLFRYIQNEVRRSPFFNHPQLRNPYLCSKIPELSRHIKKLRYFYDQIILLDPVWEENWT